ncbi:Uncharacterised protein [Klebsiella pneumoniae]|nr:Uncharacterised protein [Klebsiella pneumoniae]SLV12403.1 Uncharacterised protein [Klebsiella pneumoniae]SLV19461.1 Uncharacterised protein [Klebsiella pneumoniae]
MQSHTAVTGCTDIHILECTPVEVTNLLREDTRFVWDDIARHHTILINANLHPDEVDTEILYAAVFKRAVPWVKCQDTDTGSTVSIQRTGNMVADDFTTSERNETETN